MSRIQDTPVVAVIALGLACFSTGFSVTATAYASIARDNLAERATSHASGSSQESERACARQLARTESGGAR